MTSWIGKLGWLVLGVALLPGCGDKCTPQSEVCDNLDNDCNGLIDDGLQKICTTVCGLGVEVCSAGAWIDCSAPGPGVEVCNGLDDDCNGCFDEQAGGNCAPLEQACSTACAAGTEFCYLGVWQGCTAQAPAQEVCDGQDNDCDGQTDEDLDTDADTDGHHTTDSCALPNDDCDDGNPAVHPGHAEDCDGLDNDCDRQIDEGCSCTPPAVQACGSDVGDCAVGTQACQPDGSWGACLDGLGQPVVLPGDLAEACDRADNDCDSLTDEGNPSGGGDCGTDLGVCRAGTQICVDGQLECQGGVQPGVEVCNEVAQGHLDDDCDGLTDEGLPTDPWEVNDSCALSSDFGLLDDNSNNLKSVSGSLYGFASDQFVLDRDWFCVNARETSSPACIPGDPQCMYLTAQLALPQGADHTRWEMCLLDHGYSVNSSRCVQNCAAPLVQWCSDPAVDWRGSFYRMDFYWNARCFLDADSRFLAIVVRPVAGELISECRPYTLTLGMDKINQACQ